MAIVLVANLRSLQGSALRGPGLPARESLAKPKEPMVRAARMVHVAPVTRLALRAAVLGLGAMEPLVLIAVPGRHAIASLATSAMTLRAIMTPRWMPMRYPQSLTVQHGAS